MGWTLYVSISAAMLFFLTGYVARSALTTRKATSGAGSGPARHRAESDESPGEPVIPSAGQTCCIADVPIQCVGYHVDDGGRPAHPRLESEDGRTLPHSTSDDQEETLVGENLEVVDEGEPAVDDSLCGESGPVDGSLGDTPVQWGPERSVGLPPMSCPPSSKRREAFLSEVFPAEPTTRPFHERIPPIDDRWVDDDRTEEVERLRQEARRLGLEQRALAQRIDSITRTREVARPKVQVGSGAPEQLPEPGFESALGTLLETMPRDVRFGVVADSLGLPLAYTGGAQASTELAASMTWVKRMALEVGGLAGLQSPVQRVQLDDCAGEKLECWLLDTDAGLYGVLLIRRSGDADGAVEACIDDIAEALGVERGLRMSAV